MGILLRDRGEPSCYIDINIEDNSNYLNFSGLIFSSSVNFSDFSYVTASADPSSMIIISGTYPNVGIGNVSGVINRNNTTYATISGGFNSIGYSVLEYNASGTFGIQPRATLLLSPRASGLEV